LIEFLPAGRVLSSAEDLIPYSFDGTAALKRMPAAVVMAESAEEVSSVLKFAQRERRQCSCRGVRGALSGEDEPDP